MLLAMVGSVVYFYSCDELWDGNPLFTDENRALESFLCMWLACTIIPYCTYTHARNSIALMEANIYEITKQPQKDLR